MNRAVSLNQILRVLGVDRSVVRGDLRRRITAVVPIYEATSSNQLSFCAAERLDAAALVRETKAGIVLCADNADVSDIDLREKTLICVEDPRRACMRLMHRFFLPKRPQGIHRTATIHRSTRIGRRVYIGPYCYVGPDVKIGDETVIIGHVHIYGPAVIGRRCTIHAGAVIGADGFGFWRNLDGSLEKFPHVGGVRIGDDVEIGASTAIDRGTLGETVIGRGAKIDNLVHVAHNVEIGEHCGIVALSLIGGSVRIGARSWLAPSVCIRDRINVGADVMVGMGAVVTRSVPDGQTVIGVPARSLPQSPVGRSE